MKHDYKGKLDYHFDPGQTKPIGDYVREHQAKLRKRGKKPTRTQSQRLGTGKRKNVERLHGLPATTKELTGMNY